MAYYDPTFDVDFAAGDSPVTKYGFSFTRATTATYVNASGLIATAASGELRYTYDPVTLSALGVLIEEQRTNLALASADLSNASYWSSLGLTAVSANGATAPDGAATADGIVADATSTASHRVSAASVITVSSATVYTLSVYLKPGNKNYALLSYSGAYPYVGYDLVTGTVTGIGTNTVSASATATLVGNGWCRCTLTVTTSGTTITPQIYAYHQSYAGGGSVPANWAGDAATVNTWVWGAQFEAGAFPTSYIPTTGTAATRNADVLSLTGAAGRTNLIVGSAAPATQNVTVTATAYTLSQTGSGTITLSGASTAGPLVGAGSLTFTPSAGTLTLTMSGSPANVQLETGSSATAYIATTNGPRTVENVATWFSGDAGTWVATAIARAGASGGTQVVVSVDDGSDNNRGQLYKRNAQLAAANAFVAAAAVQANITDAGNLSTTANVTFATAYAENDVAMYVAGSAGTADTSAAMPAKTYIVHIGCGSGSLQQLCGTISRIRYYNSRIPNADLILLSNGVDLSTPRASGGGIPKRKRKPRRIVVDDVIYDVPERDLPAFIDSLIQARSVPASVEVTVDQRPDTGVQQAVAPEVRLPPRGETPESLQARADALRVHLMRQQADRALLVLIDRTIARLMAEIEDEEEAAIALLLH